MGLTDEVVGAMIEAAAFGLVLQGHVGVFQGHCMHACGSREGGGAWG